MPEKVQETYEELQSYADILDDIQHTCEALAEAEDTDGNSEVVRWRAKGYKEI
jgi:hypothetical protein